MANEVIIIHNPSDRFGKDCITIDIQNVSFGALYLLQKDLEKNLEKWEQEVENGLGWHPTTDSYLDLLKKITLLLNEKLKENG